MGLTITATFEKQGIYFAGDTLECHIRFSNERSAQPLAAAVSNSHNGISADKTLSQAVASLPYMMTTGAAASSTTPASLSTSGFMSNGPSRIASRKTTGRILSPFSAANIIGASSRRSGTNDALFASIDSYSEHSGTPPMPPLPNDSRRYSATANFRDGGSRLQNAVGRPSRASNSSTDTKGIISRAQDRSETGIHYQCVQPALAAFPSLDEKSAEYEEPVSPSRLHAPRSVRGSTAGGAAYKGDGSGAIDRGLSPTPTKSQMRQQTRNGYDTGLSIQLPGLGGGRQSRISTSSVLSTPTTSFSSWLPFGGKQQQQQQLGIFPSRKPTYNGTNDGAPSETGSSGLLSNLWRNLSGGSNPPSRPGTRAGTMTEDDLGIEKLAIGFAEASGSLALSTSYIKPEQMELLLMHKGTDYDVSKNRKQDPPIGGGLGGWVPGGSSGHASSRTQKSLPLLISSPTVLFSELSLAPGDSQTFSLTMRLPESLPPSFRGRSACITYDLVIVAKRSMLESSSYVARIPFRVLAHVGAAGTPRRFGFERPIRMSPNSSQLTFQESNLVSTPRNASPSLVVDSDELSQTSADSIDACCTDANRPLSDSLDKAYDQLAESSFLQSLLQSTETNILNPASNPRTSTTDLNDAASQSSELGADVSKANIQKVCRKRAPVSFSLSQADCTLASVWLPKRNFQLGDMLTGRVDILAGSIRVYQISIWLESIESVGSQFANYEQAQTEELTRKVFAEHHGFCRGNSTIGFSLATSPSAASSFESQLVSNVWQLRIELIISVQKGTGTDMVLSAATPFPPCTNQAKSPNLSISTSLLSSNSQNNRGLGSDRPHETSSVLSLAPAPTSPVLSSPPPVMPLFGSAQQSKSGLRSGRLRSSTVVGNSPYQLSHPRIVSRSAVTPVEPQEKNNDSIETSFSPLSGGLSRHSFDYQRLPSAHRSSMEHHNPQTVRRRFDVASQVQTQTLSCTVPIQMHPSLNRTHADGQKDSYTVDLTKRN
ncbi:Golgi membrane exchange factor (Ric1p-Rgp1p) subunit [Coemansia sp. RSA 1722]|nr:Golgi membrane exchange factor (Ric1p-Rgp1p) subunit [Coemansia sp. RSA 1722]